MLLADFAYKVFYLLAYLLAWVGGIVAILSFFYGLWLRSVYKDRNERMELAANTALSELSIISGDKRYIGTESRLIARRKSDGGDGHCSYSLLCKTNQGNWFALNFEVSYSGDVINMKLTPLDEYQAKHELSPYPDLYTKEFGAPEIA